MALPVTCTLVSIPDLDFKLIADEGSAGGSDLAGKSESAKYDPLALKKRGSSAIGGSCLVLKPFKSKYLLFLEGLDRVKGMAHKDLDSGAKPL